MTKASYTHLVIMMIENATEILKKLHLSRSKSIGAGKKMGNDIWIHRSLIESHLPFAAKRINKAIADNAVFFDVVRYNLKTNSFSLISCPGFDIENEPTIGRTVLIRSNDTVLVTEPVSNPQIYHHKWMMVTDDYQSFSIIKSMYRSIEWKLKLGTDRSISSRIGRKSFWEAWLIENNMSL